MLEPDHSVLADGALDWDDEGPSNVELPDTSTCDACHSSEDMISPIATVDLSTLQTWETKPPENSDIISPITFTYPEIRRQSRVPEPPFEYREFWATTISRPLNTKPSTTSETLLPPLDEAGTWMTPFPRPPSPKAPWNSDVSLSPLNEAFAEAWESGPAQRPEQGGVEAGPESWNPDEEAARDIIESRISDVPAPLNTFDSGSSDGQKSPLEYVKAWVESWSSVAPNTCVS